MRRLVPLLLIIIVTFCYSVPAFADKIYVDGDITVVDASNIPDAEVTFEYKDPVWGSRSTTFPVWNGVLKNTLSLLAEVCYMRRYQRSILTMILAMHRTSKIMFVLLKGAP